MLLTKNDLKRIPVLMLGTAILAFGLFSIHNRTHITEGGVLGATLLLQNWFNITPGITGILIDSVCYILGFRILGKNFLKYALISSAGFSLFYNIFEHLGYMLPDLSNQPLIAAVAGGLFVGVGVGIIVRAGGASGGDDALALILSKVTKRPIAQMYFFTDFVILMLSLTYIPPFKIICSLITVTLSSFLIGKFYDYGKSSQINAAE